MSIHVQQKLGRHSGFVPYSSYIIIRPRINKLFFFRLLVILAILLHNIWDNWMHAGYRPVHFALLSSESAKVVQLSHFCLSIFSSLKFWCPCFCHLCTAFKSSRMAPYSNSYFHTKKKQQQKLLTYPKMLLIYCGVIQLITWILPPYDTLLYPLCWCQD